MESLLAQVWEGLSRPFGQKFIPHAYQYDEKGSQLFSQMESLPEYYLTRSEMSILRDPHTVQRMQTLLSLSNPSHLTLVDLGAGDGCKTLGFMEQWCSQAKAEGTAGSMKYIPIDISAEACRQVADTFEHSNWKQTTAWKVACQPIIGDSLTELEKLREQQPTPICVFFIGSTLGIFDAKQRSDYLRQLRKCLHPGDYLLLGLDLLKSHHLLIPAYSDLQGVVANINFNIIHRLNKDFDMTFLPSDFEYYATYNPHIQAMECFLVSRKELKFKTIILGANEMINTLVSRKFRLEDIPSIAESAGFQWVTNFMDNEQFFVDTLWKV